VGSERWDHGQRRSNQFAKSAAINNAQVEQPPRLWPGHCGSARIEALSDGYAP
jgi:hypothetical protein